MIISKRTISVKNDDITFSSFHSFRNVSDMYISQSVFIPAQDVLPTDE